MYNCSINKPNFGAFAMTLLFAGLCMSACSTQHKEAEQLEKLTKGKDIGGCVHAGCNNELCVKEGDPGSVSACVSKPEFACYAAADCAPNADTGACEFVADTPIADSTLNLTQCLDEKGGNETGELNQGGCVHGGCSGQLCVDAEENDGLATTCEWREEYACYQKAVCARNSEGKCKFVESQKLNYCLENVKLNQDGCIHSCHGRCADEADAKQACTKEIRADEQCYQKAVCARNTDGVCATVVTDTFNECVAESQS